MPDAVHACYHSGHPVGETEETLGERIKSARLALGWTQSELARRAKLTPAAIWQLEAGEREPTARTICKLCRALRISADWFLGLDQPPRVRQAIPGDE